jgi:hypothetical protein
MIHPMQIPVSQLMEALNALPNPKFHASNYYELALPELLPDNWVARESLEQQSTVEFVDRRWIFMKIKKHDDRQYGYEWALIKTPQQ